MKEINLYKDSITQVGLLLSAKKVVEKENNGALTAYYILTVEYINGMSYKHCFYPDNKILTLVGKDIIFDCINYDQEKIITHIY